MLFLGNARETCIIVSVRIVKFAIENHRCRNNSHYFNAIIHSHQFIENLFPGTIDY